MSDETKWNEHGVEAKIKAILAAVQPDKEKAHMGRPFLSAYQIALTLRDKDPETFGKLGMEMGGAGSGQLTSLPQYLARQLSQGIQHGTISRIEMATFSRKYLRALTFNNQGADLDSSLHPSGLDLSLFRLKG